MDADWESALARLGRPYRYRQDHFGEVVWEGDLMSRENPLWHGTVLVQGHSGNLTVINQKASRTFLQDQLRQVVYSTSPAVLPRPALQEEPSSDADPRV